jgi:cytochrome c-type biogenesis protein CcmH/NrfG
MSDREHHTNQSLRALDEAHRLGRLTREEYRARRRHLLTALRDSHVVTARNAIARPPAQQERSLPATTGNDLLVDMLAPRRAMWKWMAALLLVVVVCAGVAYWLWGTHRPG